jgi:hypothetical protein
MQNNMKNRQLSQEHKDILFGTLLGDGNLQTFSQGNLWRYRALQSKDQLEYLTHKYEILKDFCSTGIIYGEVWDERTGKLTKRNYFNTVVVEGFSLYAKMFYTYDENTGKYVKDVPKNVAEHLTPRALAYLHQDDGALKMKGSAALRICTESFSQAGVQRLSDAIKANFGIETSLAPKYREVEGGLKEIAGYRLYIPTRSGKAFCDLIRSYVVESLEYKLSVK